LQYNIAILTTLGAWRFNPLGITFPEQQFIAQYTRSALKLAFILLLADGTNGRAYGTMLCPSVVFLFVTYIYIVAKRYVLPKNCLQKQIRLPDRYRVVQIRTPYDPRFPQTGVLTVPQILELRIAAKPLVSGMVTINSLYELTNALSNGTIAEALQTPVLSK